MHRLRITTVLLASLASLSALSAAPFPAPGDPSAYPRVALVDTHIMSARGRWFFFGSGKRPFGMVSVFPDTRNAGQDGGGYNYNSTDVVGFSHLHGWMTVGLDVMPTAGGDYTLTKDGWKSPFSRETEIAQPGYHKVTLSKYGLTSEVTATDRVGFHRLTFPEGGRADIIVNLGGPCGSAVMRNGRITKTGDREIEGFYDRTDGFWGGPPTVRTFFVIRFDRDFSELREWSNDDTLPQPPPGMGGETSYGDRSGIVVFEGLPEGARIQMKAALSFTSIGNARKNLEAECDHWDFDRVRHESQSVWDQWFGRIDVKGGRPDQRTKFYTDLWHVLMGRHKLDDVDGSVPDYTDGKGNNTRELKVRRIPAGPDGKPAHHYYNADSFWLTNFNLNILWGLAYPDVLRDFGRSFLALDKWGGILPRGPNGGGYSYIMTGCPATPLLVSAHNLGVLDVPGDELLEVIRRNHLPGSGMDKLYGDLPHYIEKGYSPWTGHETFDMSAGLTLEWANADWCAAALAEKVGNTALRDEFMARARNYATLWDSSTGLMRPRKSDGSWMEPFCPMRWYGYVEGNAWTFTWYVPQDVPGLASLMGGSDAFSKKLEHVLRQEQPHKFGRGHAGHFDYGNQPSCHMAHLFNHVGKPWLTQYWVREVSELAFGGTTPHDGYCGEEDQGQMGALSALMKVGLFSVRGACDTEPRYEITSPVFDEVTFQPDTVRTRPFVIRTHGNSDANRYIQRAAFNGNPHDRCWISRAEFEAGGTLELWLGPDPNTSWGLGGVPQSPAWDSPPTAPPLQRADLAPSATITASSEFGSGLGPGNVAMEVGNEWSAKGEEKPWIRLGWKAPVEISSVVLADRRNPVDHAVAGTLEFSDGTQIDVEDIPNDGSPKEVDFAPRSVDWVMFRVTQSSGPNIGLSKVSVFGNAETR